MHARATELIQRLGLQPHPEGGFYRETWRSALRTLACESGRERCALTNIYFLLAAGGFSAWHRVRSDETWHWYEGEPVELLSVSPDLGELRRDRLGQVADGMQPSITVPADWWQAARPLGAYALCGCSVSPGFEFMDFSFLRDDAAATDAIARLSPELLMLL